MIEELEFTFKSLKLSKMFYSVVLFTYVITMCKAIYIWNIHFRICHLLLHLMNLESN